MRYDGDPELGWLISAGWSTLIALLAGVAGWMNVSLVAACWALVSACVCMVYEVGDHE